MTSSILMFVGTLSTIYVMAVLSLSAFVCVSENFDSMCFVNTMPVPSVLLSVTVPVFYEITDLDLSELVVIFRCCMVPTCFVDECIFGGSALMIDF